MDADQLREWLGLPERAVAELPVPAEAEAAMERTHELAEEWTGGGQLPKPSGGKLRMDRRRYTRC